MHVSERLLQLYAEHDRSKRIALQSVITQNLGEGKSLAVSYREVTGHEPTAPLSDDPQSAAAFTQWLEEGRNDNAFLLYYVALLEQIDHILDKEATFPADAVPAPLPDLPVESKQKKRYVPEVPVPSRADRSKHQRTIEPARAKKRGIGWLLLPLVLLLAVGGYFAYPIITDLLAPKQTVPPFTEAPVETPDPVVEQPETAYAWLTVKNVDLLTDPAETDVTYVGDIGDRYELLNETDGYVEVDVNGTSAYAPIDTVTTEWRDATLTDAALLRFVTDNLDGTWLGDSTNSDLFVMNEAALTASIGEPYARETDALNAYAFYSGGFVVIQDDRVHAVDWTNTGITKDAFLELGTPTLETEDAVVYESDTYSLRLFAGLNDQTRIRLTAL